MGVSLVLEEHTHINLSTLVLKIWCDGIGFNPRWWERQIKWSNIQALESRRRLRCLH